VFIAAPILIYLGVGTTRTAADEAPERPERSERPQRQERPQRTQRP